MRALVSLGGDVTPICKKLGRGGPKMAAVTNMRVATKMRVDTNMPAATNY